MSFISRVFIKGLLALLPITLTLFLLGWLATRTEQIFGEPLSRLSFYFPGAGVILAMILVFFVGLLVNNYLTQKFFDWLEHQVEKMPIIKTIYNPLRDVTSLFARGGSGQSNQRVVMVPLGPSGVEVMGLVTRDHFEDLPSSTLKADSVAVFVPLSYGIGGITVLVPRNSMREVPLSAERALQLAITGWVKASKS